MRTFNHPSTAGGWICPICHTAGDKPVVLIPIYGTQQDHLIEAQQFHLDCIDLCYYPKTGVIAMPVEIEGGQDA